MDAAKHARCGLKCRSCHFLVIRSGTNLKENPEILERAESLLAIGRAGTGNDNIDMRAATDKGVVVFNVPGENSPPVVETVAWFIISVLRGFPRAYRLAKGGTWAIKQFKGREVGEKIVGIVGMGNVGGPLAKVCRALGAEVVFYDIEQSIRTEHARRPASPEELLAASDIVSLNIPSTRKTRGLIDAQALALFKQGACLVNTARGDLVKTDDVFQALQSGRLGAFAADVHETEGRGFGNHPIFRLENFYPLPHIAGHTHRFPVQPRISLQIAEKAHRFLNHGEVLGALNAPSCKLEVNPEKEVVHRVVVYHRDMTGILVDILSASGKPESACRAKTRA